jgi:ribonuclease R
MEVTPLQGGLLLEMISDPLPAPAGRSAARKAISRDSDGTRSHRGGGGPPRRSKPKFDKRTLPPGSTKKKRR